MYPPSFLSAQRTIRVWAIVGLVVFGSLSVFVGTTALAGTPHAGGRFMYNVTFMMANKTEPGGAGTAPYLQTTDVTVKISGENITNVSFEISWTDQSFSPFTNPSVSATITGPNGTGTQSGRVNPSGSKLSVAVPNEMPANATVEASSEADALAKVAINGTNSTLGSGDWTVSLQVGAALGGRIRQGSVSYTIAVQVDYFVGSAKRL